jgi:hypothetical protein
MIRTLEVPMHTDVLDPPFAPIHLPTELAWALAGLSAASLLTAAGSAAAFDVGLTSAAVTTGLSLGPSIALRTAVLTAPSLLAVAVVRGLPLTAGQVASAVAAGLTRAGRLAGGATPALLLFALTTRWTPLLALAVITWAGLAGLATTAAALRAHTPDRTLIAAWQLLSLLIGARLVFDGTVELARVVLHL